MKFVIYTPKALHALLPPFPFPTVGTFSCCFLCHVCIVSMRFCVYREPRCDDLFLYYFVRAKRSIAIMVGDQYANYVVQKILGFCNVEQKVRVLKKIMEIPNFHKVAFGKHIIFAVDKLRASLRDRLNLEFDEHPENVAAFNSMHK